MDRFEKWAFQFRIQRAGLLVAALQLTLPAAGQPSPVERARERPSIAALFPQQQIVFDDGRYALVDNKSVADRQKQKQVEAKCPSGMKAMSAGFAAASGRGEPPGYRVILSTPVDNGAGWRIYAAFDSSGNLLAADFDWELRIHLVCAKMT